MLPIITIAFVRLSERILILSLLNCPSLLLLGAPPAVEEELLKRALAASAREVLFVAGAAPPLEVFFFASAFLLEALPIRSFSIVETSSASANSRRFTSTLTSGVVSRSSTLMINSKKSIFSLRVMIINWLVRSSAIICTLPRIIPRSASLTRASIEAFGVALGFGAGVFLRLRSCARREEIDEAEDVERAMPGEPDDLDLTSLLLLVAF